MSQRDIGHQQARVQQDARSDQRIMPPSRDLTSAPSRRTCRPRHALVICVVVLAGCSSANSKPSAVPTASAAPSRAASTGAPGVGPTPTTTAPARTPKSRVGRTTATPSTPKSPSARAAAVPLKATTGIQVAVRLYSDSSLAGDASTAYRLLSVRCQARVSEKEFAAKAAGSGRFTSVLTVKAKVHGDRALTSYTYPIKALNQTAEPWVREGGEWRRNRC